MPVALLASCAATQTMIEHRNLESSTRLSQTVFLEPVAPSQKTIYVAIRNTSDEAIDVTRPLINSLTQKGYKVVNNPANAHYQLQANIVRVAKMSRSASSKALGGGYGSALAGAGVGGAVGALTGNTNAMIGGGLAGAAIGLAADSLVKEVNFTMVTDIQLSERVGKGVTVREHFSSSLDNGTASNTYQTSTNSSAFQRYRTRIVSDATQVNLTFAKAKPALESGLIKTVSGLF